MEYSSLPPFHPLWCWFGNKWILFFLDIFTGNSFDQVDVNLPRMEARCFVIQTLDILHHLSAVNARFAVLQTVSGFPVKQALWLQLIALESKSINTSKHLILLCHFHIFRVLPHWVRIQSLWRGDVASTDFFFLFFWMREREREDEYMRIAWLTN